MSRELYRYVVAYWTLEQAEALPLWPPAEQPQDGLVNVRTDGMLPPTRFGDDVPRLG